MLKNNYNSISQDQKDGILSVVFITDDRFLDYTLVAIGSLLKNTSIKLRIYLMYCKIPIELLNKSLNLLDSYSREIICLEYNENHFNHLASHDKNDNLTTYAKFEIINMIPENYVLYLDSDLIVLSDIATITTFIQKDKMIMAVRNPAFPIWKDYKALNFERKQLTFNAGVLYMNLQKMRATNLRDQLYTFSNDFYNKLHLHDEPAWNYCCQKDWAELPIEFNLTTLYFRRHPYILGINPKSFKNILSKKVIIHFSGKDKPWKISSPHPLNKKWRKLYYDIFHKNVIEKVTLKDNLFRIRKKLKSIISYCRN